MNQETHQQPEAVAIKLELATLADADAYLKLQKKAASETYSPVEDQAELLEDISKGPVCVVKHGKEIIGSISFYMRDTKSAYISAFVVDPKYQNRGLGKEIFKKVLDELQNVPLIQLITHPNNHNALGLYKSFGFVITQEHDNYYGNGEKRVTLTLDKSGRQPER